ncbi:MAG: hypothetical protein U9N03_03525, partial [Candidatus Caldatribacteriota bacterium]|nr:hypothetical protein [Candidatus Caldatribacteriota bacterium]
MFFDYGKKSGFYSGILLDFEGIDKELEKLIKQDPQIFQRASNLDSIPGCGMLLAAHLLVITE